MAAEKIKVIFIEGGQEKDSREEEAGVFIREQAPGRLSIGLVQEGRDRDH